MNSHFKSFSLNNDMIHEKSLKNHNINTNPEMANSGMSYT
jgi:hypothetical protein